MPVRIRKSFNLFPGVKVNMSKGGVSFTVGRKGFHLNFSKRGVRQTVGLPGSGISESSYIFKDKSEENKKETETEPTEEGPKRKRAKRTVRERVSSPWGFFAFVFIALFFIYFGASAFGLLPPNLITNFLHTLTQWAQQVGL
jgi:hypothetical protein